MPKPDQETDYLKHADKDSVQSQKGTEKSVEQSAGAKLFDEVFAGTFYRVPAVAIVGTLGGIKHGFDQAMEHKGETTVKLLGAVAFGLTMGYAERGVTLLRLGSEALATFGTFNFLTDIVAPKRLGAIKHALGDAWKSGNNLDHDKALMGDNAGRFAFDTGLMMLGGASGYGLSKAKLENHINPESIKSTYKNALTTLRDKGESIENAYYDLLAKFRNKDAAKQQAYQNDLASVRKKEGPYFDNEYHQTETKPKKEISTVCKTEQKFDYATIEETAIKDRIARMKDGILNLSGFTSMIKLPELPADTKILNLSKNSNLIDVSSLANCPDLEQVNFEGCSSLQDVSPMANLLKLRKVNFLDCSQLEIISPLSNIKTIKDLKTSGSKIKDDPAKYINKDSIVEIKAENKHAAKKEIDYANIKERETQEINDRIKGMKGGNLNLAGFTSMIKLPELPPGTRILNLSRNANLVDVSSMANATDLEQVIFEGCEKLKAFPKTIQLTKLKIVDFSECGLMEDISGLSHSKDLKKAVFDKCSSLKDFSPLQDLSKLQFASFGWCSGLTNISFLTNAKVLKDLNLTCTGVVDISPLATTDSMEKLNLSHTKIKDFSLLRQLRKITELNLLGCKQNKSATESVDNLISTDTGFFYYKFDQVNRYKHSA